MKKIILIIEDLKDEQEKAKRAAASLGLGFVVVETLEDFDRIIETMKTKVSGIVTDLHFPERSKMHDADNHAGNPNGLAVIAAAIRLGLPISVCSNINNHFAAYLTRVVATFEKFSPYGSIPFTMNTKDWNKAFEQLMQIIQKEKLNE